MKRSVSFLFVIFLLGVFPFTAKESILSFHSDVVVEKNSSLLVTETIVVNAEGVNIKHGIFRDFPTKYKTAEGLNYSVSFEINYVTRDGSSEKWFTNKLSNGTRIYIGNKDTYVPAGSHTYVLNYRTKGQIGFFKDHDELYWNVTGTGWSFSIENASCAVYLPEGVRAETIKTDGFTGPFGAKDKNFTYSLQQGKIPVFKTTKPLSANEGLTIVAGFNKGVLLEPSETEKLLNKLNDNKGVLLILASFTVIFFYYFIFWFRYGRDPGKGVIVPRFEPPKWVSAAGMRYLVKMGFDSKTFATALVSMAVKGYLTISKEGEDFVVIGKNEDESLLSIDEKILAKSLPHLKTGFTFHNKSAAIIKKIFTDTQKELSKEYENKYFITNYKHMIPGMLISIICIIVTGIYSALSSGDIAMFGFMSIWLSIWTIGVIFLGVSVFTGWKNVATGGIAGFGVTVFLTLFSVPFFAGEVIGCIMMIKATSVFFLIFFILAIAVNALFYYLLKAPTELGRKALDEIEGLKLFLSVSEKESIDYSIRINKNVYEKFLPYAMALDVEKNWSEKFAAALAVSGEDKVSYQPSWYTGAAFGAGFYAGSFASDFSSSFSSSVSSSSTPPGSSSGFSGGGGGGSSGGGGGGGGGGGW